MYEGLTDRWTRIARACPTASIFSTPTGFSAHLRPGPCTLRAHGLPELITMMEAELGLKESR